MRIEDELLREDLASLDFPDNATAPPPGKYARCIGWIRAPLQVLLREVSNEVMRCRVDLVDTCVRASVTLWHGGASDFIANSQVHPIFINASTAKTLPIVEVSPKTLSWFFCARSPTKL